MDRISPVLKKHGYVPLRKVGSGSFGQAWLVGQQDGDGGKMENYVCKMIDISRCSKKEKQDALHEASVLRDLKHPYVVRYKESFLEDGWLCIVQEYCEGGDLYQRIQKAKKMHQTFSEDQIVKWFTQCIMGLKFIHDKHILHRDLKSSNFFLTKTGDIKMGDFGIAKVLESTAAVAKTQIGTPYYLSPEICQEKAYAWPSDIWAMGCILFELCCLRVPFDAADLRALVHRITRGPSPTLPSHFSPQLRQLVSEILVRDHTRRPTATVILSKPILRDRMDKLNRDLNEKQQRDDDAIAGAAGAGGAEDDIKKVEAALKAAPDNDKKVSGPYSEEAGKYVKNQIVEYYSETHKEWLPAQITAVDADGRIQVHCKPNAWLSLSVQASKVRPKQEENKENKPRPPAIPDGGQKAHGDARGGPSRSSSQYTPRYAAGSGAGAATPPISYQRQQTPPQNHYPPVRVGSPSPFGRAGTPRGAAYYARHGTPRGGGGGAVAALGTPRNAASPLIRPFQNHSPRPAGYSGASGGRFY